MWWLIKATMILKIETGTGSLASLGTQQTFPNIITANWFSALLEQKHWAEAEETLEQFLHRAKNKQDKMGYHLLRTDYARAIGDTGLEEQERLLSQQLKNQLGNKRENQEYLQTPKRVNMLSFAGFPSVLVWHCWESSAI